MKDNKEELETELSQSITTSAKLAAEITCLNEAKMELIEALVYLRSLSDRTVQRYIDELLSKHKL